MKDLQSGIGNEKSYSAFEANVILQNLAYSTHLLASELNREQFVSLALETLLDFSHGRRAIFYVPDPAKRGDILVLGDYYDSSLRNSMTTITLEQEQIDEFLSRKEISSYSFVDKHGLIIPVEEGDNDDPPCLFLPLVNRRSDVIGFIVLEMGTVGPSDFEMRVLNVLMTLISVAYENTQLFEMATVDGLTRLYVRRFFEIRLQEEIKRVERFGGTVSLLITDIDQFKDINDTYGHQQGDIVLKDLAKLIRDSLRLDLDVPCRYGGDEFAIILPDTSSRGAYEVSERMRVECEETVFHSGSSEIRATFSGGIASMTRHDHIGKHEFIERADTALYRAKQSGRNQIRVWRKE